jgi:hypothetical protein
MSKVCPDHLLCAKKESEPVQTEKQLRTQKQGQYLIQCKSQSSCSRVAHVSHQAMVSRGNWGSFLLPKKWRPHLRLLSSLSSIKKLRPGAYILENLGRWSSSLDFWGRNCPTLGKIPFVNQWEKCQRIACSETLRKMGFYGDLMGFYGDLMGFYGEKNRFLHIPNYSLFSAAC